MRRLVLPLVLAVLAIGVHAGALSNGFTNYDDNAYVTANPRVLAGLTADGLRWALVAGEHANWHPLTWWSHMLDVEIWGLDPRGHHLTSVLLHAVCVVLLFGLLEAASGARWPSAAAAALFAVHPLHVETVAWVAQRKSVLSLALGLAAMLAHVLAVRRPGGAARIWVAVLLALGLAAKPMLVTLPFVLLLLDAWPLGRLRTRGDLPGLLREKAVPFALCAASSVVTWVVQRGGGAMEAADPLPLGLRLGNAVVAVVDYVRLAFWPAGLAPFYPHPGADLPGWKPAVAAGLLIGATYLALRLRARAPFVAVGWLWFLVTLVPVLGIVQVGEQAMADRYAYLASIGLFVIAAWGGAALAPRASVVAGAVAIAALAVAASRQVQVWRDTETLFRHTLAVTGPNHVASIQLALAAERRGDPAAAEAHYRAALRVRPRSAVALHNLGFLAAEAGRLEEAILRYRAALELRPGYFDAWNDLGIALARSGRPAEAELAFRRALAIAPSHPMVEANIKKLRGQLP